MFDIRYWRFAKTNRKEKKKNFSTKVVRCFFFHRFRSLFLSHKFDLRLMLMFHFLDDEKDLRWFVFVQNLITAEDLSEWLEETPMERSNQSTLLSLTDNRIRFHSFRWSTLNSMSNAIRTIFLHVSFRWTLSNLFQLFQQKFHVSNVFVLKKTNSQLKRQNKTKQNELVFDSDASSSKSLNCSIRLALLIDKARSANSIASSLNEQTNPNERRSFFIFTIEHVFSSKLLTEIDLLILVVRILSMPEENVVFFLKFRQFSLRKIRTFCTAASASWINLLKPAYFNSQRVEIHEYSKYFP